MNRRLFLQSLAAASGVTLLDGCSLDFLSMPTPIRPGPGEVFCFVPMRRKLIALTFDDGPNDPYTTRILDLFRDEQVKATFFLVGKNAEYYPDTAVRIVAEGHEVGNHSYAHGDFPKLSAAEIDAEIVQGSDAIERVTTVRPRFFRPPYGDYGAQQYETCRRQGLPIAGWSSHARDWWILEPETIEQRIVSQACGGAIMLLHDGRMGFHEDNHAAPTVAALPGIVRALRAAGYEFVTLSELLKHAEPGLIRFANDIECLGAQYLDTPAVPGQPFSVRTYWRVPQNITRSDYVFFLHLKTGHAIVNQDDAFLPEATSIWTEVLDQELVIPQEHAPSPVSVECGLYPREHPKTSERIRPHTRLAHRHGAIRLPDLATAELPAAG